MLSVLIVLWRKCNDTEVITFCCIQIVNCSSYGIIFQVKWIYIIKCSKTLKIYSFLLILKSNMSVKYHSTLVSLNVILMSFSFNTESPWTRVWCYLYRENNRNKVSILFIFIHLSSLGYLVNRLKNKCNRNVFYSAT